MFDNTLKLGRRAAAPNSSLVIGVMSFFIPAWPMISPANWYQEQEPAFVTWYKP